MRVKTISINKKYNTCFDFIEKMSGSTSRNICEAVSNFVTNPIITENYNLSMLSKHELEALDKQISQLSYVVVKEIEKR